MPPVVGFMDDMLLIAAGSIQATQCYHQIQQLLASHGLLLHTTKTAWAASSHEPACELILDGNRVERKPGITFAGIRYQFGMIDLTDRAVRHHHVPPELLGQASSRVPAAYGVLQTYTPFLELPQAPWKLKVQLLRSTAVSSLTYMAQTCQASRQLFLKYQSLELAWLGRFLGLRKRPAESYVDFMRRRRSTARSVFLQNDMGLLSAKLLAQSFAFLGHLVRHSVASASLLLEAGPWDIELGQPRASFFRAGRPARWEQLHQDYLGLPLYASIVALHGSSAPCVSQLDALLQMDAPALSANHVDDSAPAFGDADDSAWRRQWWTECKEPFTAHYLRAWRQDASASSRTTFGSFALAQASKAIPAFARASRDDKKGGVACKGMAEPVRPSV